MPRATIPFLLALLACGGCAAGKKGDPPGDLHRFAYEYPGVGTRYRVIVYAKDASSASAGVGAAAARLGELDATLNQDRVGGELRRLCDGAGGSPRKVSDELFAVLDTSQRVGRSSGGAFDVTAAPFLELWQAAAASGAEPSDAQLEAARALVGNDKLSLDPIERTASLAVPSMRLDVAGVARGYAADALVEELKRHGIERALVDARANGTAGRTVVAGAPPPGRTGWDVAVRGLAPTAQARRKGKTVGPVLLTIANAAVAFSPNAPAVATGRPPARLIDPLTAKPATDRPWALVIGRRGLWVAPLATAAAVLGRDAGAALVRSSGAVVHFESLPARRPAR
jgi:thiamine biosynthesis lipoprotein